MATSPAHRAAQRRLARNLKAGKPILPKSVTSRAKSAVRERKADLIEKAVAHGVSKLSDKSDYFSRDGLRANLSAMSIADLTDYLNLSADEIMGRAGDSTASKAQAAGKSRTWIHKNYSSSHYWYHGW